MSCSRPFGPDQLCLQMSVCNVLFIGQVQASGPSLKLFSAILLLLRHRDPEAMVLKAWSLHTLQQVTDGVDADVSTPSQGCVHDWQLTHQS